MRPSEIIMSLCAINEYEESAKLTRGQKAYKTRLRNQLKKHRLTWAKEQLRNAARDFFLTIDNRSVYNTGVWDIGFRKNNVFRLRDARLSFNQINKKR